MINTWRGKYMLRENVITTRGVASRVVKSDEAIVEIEILNETNDLNDINEKRTKDCEAIIKYIESLGLNKDCITSVSGSHTDQINDYITSYRYYKKEETKQEDDKIAMNILKRYKVKDTIVIKTSDVDLAEKIKANTIEFAKNNPNTYFTIDVCYQYTKLDELRIAMIEQAVQDAYTRSMKIVAPTNNTVCNLNNCSISRFEVNAYGVLADSDSSYSSERKSKLKNVSVVANMTYRIK